MAFSSKNFFFLFLFTLLSSKHIYARESRFFSKIPRISNDNAKTLEEEAKEIEKQVLGPLYTENDQNFIPENESDGRFGLYGQSNEKFASLDNETVDKTVENFVSLDNGIVNITDRDKTVGKFASFDNGVFNGDTDKTTVTPDADRPYLPYDNEVKDNLPNYLSSKYNTHESYVTGYHGFTGKDLKVGQKNYATSEDVKALEKEGMSDTKFLEDGRYFYDVNLEKKNENRGYYGNQENISNDYKNSFDGYKNKAQFEDFKFDDELP